MERPNIVLLSIDTLRADSLRAYDPSSRPHETLEAEEHVPHVASRRPRTREAPAQVRKTTEVVDQLRALGYIQ